MLVEGYHIASQLFCSEWIDRFLAPDIPMPRWPGFPADQASPDELPVDDPNEWIPLQAGVPAHAGDNHWIYDGPNCHHGNGQIIEIPPLIIPCPG